MVYHLPTQRFFVYADRKLWPQPVLDLILTRFGLRGHAHELRGDPHYVSMRPLGRIAPTQPPNAGNHD